MKKAILATAMLLCTGIGANAQSIPSAERAALNQQTDYVIQTLLDRQVGKVASKTTTVANERLLAQSDYSTANTAFVFANTDSSRYEYSGNLYSQFNLNTLQFGTYIVPYGDLPFGYGTYNNIGIAQPNNTPDILCNKATYWHNGTGPTGTLDKRDTFLQQHNTSYLVSGYDNVQLAGTPYRTIVNNTFGPPYDYVYTTTILGGAPTATDTLQRRYYAYDGLNNLVVDSSFNKVSGTWQLTGRYVYVYTLGVLNRIRYFTYSLGAWTEAIRYDFSYYSAPADPYLKTVTTYNTVFSTLTLARKDSFGYTAPYSFITYSNRKDYHSDTVFGQQFSSRIISPSSHLPETVLYRATGSGLASDLKIKTTYIYDSYNQPISSTQTKYDSATAAYTNLLKESHFYYEIYWPESVAGTSQPVAKMTTYPNPARSYVNVSFGGVPAGKLMKVKLMSTLGNIVVDKDIVWNNSAEQVSVADLAPGIYWLMVSDANGDYSCRQMVVRE